MNKENIKEKLESGLNGRLPLFFREISVVDKKTDGIMNTRFIEVDEYQTPNYILPLAYRKPISKVFHKE